MGRRIYNKEVKRLRKGYPNRGNRKCKGPEVKSWLPYRSSSSKYMWGLSEVVAITEVHRQGGLNNILSVLEAECQHGGALGDGPPSGS